MKALLSILNDELSIYLKEEKLHFCGKVLARISFKIMKMFMIICW